SHRVDWLMPTTQQGGADSRQRGPHPLLHRKTKKLEATVTSGAAAMRKAEKVESLRSPLSLLAAPLRRKATELNQSRLIRVQGQTEAGQTLLQLLQEALCRFLAFKAKHTVIGITNENDFPGGLSLTPPVSP